MLIKDLSKLIEEDDTYCFVEALSQFTVLPPIDCYGRLLYAYKSFDNQWNKRMAVQQFYPMKALSTGKASSFFQKAEKPQVDPETILNKLEAKQIARRIGVADFQIDKMGWFFDQVFKLRLPQGWIRKLSLDANQVLYLKTGGGVPTPDHPHISLLKIYFYEASSNRKGAPSFRDKQRKLLAFVEDKMVKQCIGLNSKRRDAEKVNMQRDQNGKMVVSKLARIEPDLKALVSARSYMLKMLVEKIFLKKELWGRGKLANCYASLLSDTRSKGDYLEWENDAGGPQTSLELYQSIYAEAGRHYEKEYSSLAKIPDQLFDTADYMSATPESVVRNLTILNVSESNIEMYWLGRLMGCLPLPINWARVPSLPYDEYFHEPSGLQFSIHPSYLYVVGLVGTFRVEFSALSAAKQQVCLSNRMMQFYDYFERPYQVDMFDATQKAPIRTFENDWVIRESIRLLNMPATEYPNIGILVDFWNSLDPSEESWAAVVGPYGDLVWTSTVHGRASSACPYTTQLTAHYNIGKPIVCFKDSDLAAYDNSHKVPIRQSFLTHYLLHNPKPLSQPFPVKEEKNFFERYFSSGFDLDSGVEGDLEAPSWLKQCRLDRETHHHFSLLQTDPEQFTPLLVDYGKKLRTKTEELEPYMSEEHILMIRAVGNINQLKGLISYTNSHLAFERRRNEFLLRGQPEEEDLFGSDVSNIEFESEEEDNISQRNAENSDNDSSEDQEPEQNEVLVAQEEQQSFNSDDSKQQPEQLEVQQVVEPVVEPPPKHVIPYFLIAKHYQQKVSVNLLSSEQLKLALKRELKSKQSKHRYSQQGICDTYLNKFIQAGDLEARNLILTGLAHSNQPARTNIKTRQVFKCQSEFIEPDLDCDRTGFHSETEEADNQDIEVIIANRRRQIAYQLELKRQRQQEQRKKVVDQDETQQTIIILQPLKPNKPPITEDPFLLHISQVNDPNQFGRLFQTKTQSTTRRSHGSKQRVTSMAQTTPSAQKNTSELLERKLSTTGGLMTRAKSKPAFSNPQKTVFHRVCLATTVDHFMKSEAVLSKCDFAKIEARKTLLSKGRGLPNFVSQKY